MAAPNETMNELSTHVWAHAAVAAALDTGIATDPAAPQGPVAAALRDVLDALDLAPPAFEPAVVPPLGEALRAELRSDALQSRSLVDSAARGDLEGAGWIDVDEDTVDAQGETGRVFQFVAQILFPGLGNLDERLREPGAAFLDVGAGAAVLSIELCRLYPEVLAVGLEPLGLVRRVAARKIAEADLGDRIEMRDQLVQDLADVGRFDLAYVPTVFLPADALERGLERVRRAMAPGGWLILLGMADSADPLTVAVRRLRITLWGGTICTAADLERLAKEHDLVDIGSPGAVGAYQPVLARVPDA